MRVIKRARDMSRLAGRLRRRGARIGFVPTMGALHQGHLSLIRAARQETDAVVVSIFVNPAQFGPREDFTRYPRPFERDRRLAAREGTDVVFAPEVSDMYPEGFRTQVEVGGWSDCLEGARRPGHFRGVATVVMKLFQIAQPAVAYFGQKDYQQTTIIRRMAEDLHLPVRIRVLPTVRERDGLAMSSRNAYLNPHEREQAAVLYRALTSAKKAIRNGERRADRLRARMRSLMRHQPGVRDEDIDFVDANTLKPVKTLRGRIVLLVSARVGRTRLIDNLLVDVT